MTKYIIEYWDRLDPTTTTRSINFDDTADEATEQFLADHLARYGEDWLDDVAVLKVAPADEAAEVIPPEAMEHIEFIANSQDFRK
jgi:hypothetical protein